MIKNWILALRPKTLFASISPVILGLSIAYFEQTQINLVVAILTLLCALFMQLASNIANDFLDAQKGIDTEERLGPLRVTQAGLIAPQQMKRALILFLVIAFFLGIYLMIIGGPFIMAVGFLSLYFAYGYSGGPFPLSYNGLGEIAAFIFFGLIAVSGTTYLQTNHFSPMAIFLGMGPGFISAAILAVNNLRDIKTDRETKKRTIAVAFGEAFQRKLCIILISLSALVLFLASLFYQLIWLLPLTALPLIFIKNWIHLLKNPIDQKLNQVLASTAQYLLVYSLSSSLSLLHAKGLF